jgi:DivIVA domain-containing protein
MALSPQDIRDATFKSVKRGGLDPDEVSEFKLAAADALQQAIQDATAMEARARAAVARLQELSQQQAASEETSQETASAVAETPAGAPPEPVRREPTVDEAETISRTLLLAQRTADTTVAEAKAEAEATIGSAQAEAARLLESAREEAAAVIEAARAESRKAGEAERVRVEGEVQALLARRDFLESDVDQLEQHLGAQRERITEVVAELESLTDRTANGLAPMRRPQLSASDQASSPAAAVPGVDEGVDDLSDDVVDDGSDIDDEDEPDVAELIDEVVETADSGGEELGEIARVAGVDPDRNTPADGRHSLFDHEA